jgi:DNA repair exonuclease SbcCD ATPase subunit
MKDAVQILKLLELKENELQINQKNYRESCIKISKIKKLIRILEKAQDLIILIGEKTTADTVNHIENTVALALQSAFGTNYKFVIDIQNKRDQQEFKFFIDKDGMKLEPRDDLGGVGIVDVIAFALRLVIWSLESSTAPPILIFDEPFKNVSAKYIPKVLLMVKEITELLDIQIIMVTHADILKEHADNIIVIASEGDKNDNDQKPIGSSKKGKYILNRKSNGTRDNDK